MHIFDMHIFPVGHHHSTAALVGDGDITQEDMFDAVKLHAHHQVGGDVPCFFIAVVTLSGRVVVVDAAKERDIPVTNGFQVEIGVPDETAIRAVGEEKAARLAGTFDRLE